MKLSSIRSLKSEALRWLAASLPCLAGAVVLALASGCARTAGTSGGRVYQIPWPGENGVYSVEKITIDGFDAPGRLQGRFAKIFVDPYVADGRLQGPDPVGRFIETDDGTIVPADYATLQATVIQAHADRLHEMDRQLGIENVAWPITIGIQANVVDKVGWVSNNAVFDNKLDALLIVPYSQDKLPIALNAGILAHEHFHKIFQEKVLDGLTGFGPIADKPGSHAGSADSAHWASARGLRTPPWRLAPLVDESEAAPVPEDVYNGFLLRSMNEGLADFWGWAYTGDPSFITHSLPAEGIHRRLDASIPYEEPLTLESLKNRLRNPDDARELLSEGGRTGLAYYVGGRYARFLREFTMSLADKSGRLDGEPDVEARMKVARALVQVLPQLREATLQAYSSRGKSYLSPMAIIKAVHEQLKSDVTPSVCGVFTRFQTGSDDAEPISCSTVPVPVASPIPTPTPEPTPALDDGGEG